MTHSLRSPSLNHRWHKAAYLGSLWASVEIVLGSFLHNMKFPLTGTILSAIGIALLIAGHSLWKEKGIIWRAGIICAVMKSVSPSAVILGPMIGISLEAFIVEAAVRISSGNALGYIIGGAIACITPLFQKIISYLFTYGNNIAIVFEKLVEFAAKSLKIPSLSAENVIAALVISNVMLGGIAAWSGMIIGKRAKAYAHDPKSIMNNGSNEPRTKSIHQQFSLLLLIANFFVLTAGMITQSAFFLFFIPMWYLRYHQVRKRFAKIFFWLEIGGVSLSAGIFLGAFVLFDITAGALLGLQMFLRAMFIVTAFGAISAELRNPVIATFMMKKRLRNFSLALESAFNSLPVMIDRIQMERTFFKHPINSLARVLSYTDALITYREQRPSFYILTGKKGSGKSSFLRTLKDSLTNDNVSVGGIIQPGIWKGNERHGFDIVDLMTETAMPLCRTDAPNSGITAGKFNFFPEAIHFGESVLSSSQLLRKDVIILDEIGPLELSGSGWTGALHELIKNYQGTIILSVRPLLIGQVCSYFEITPEMTFDTGKDDLTMIKTSITSRC